MFSRLFNKKMYLSHVVYYCLFQNKDLFSSNETCLSAFKDVSSILYHQQSLDCHVIQALSDVHELLDSAKVQLKSTSKGKEIISTVSFFWYVLPYVLVQCHDHVVALCFTGMQTQIFSLLFLIHFC